MKQQSSAVIVLVPVCIPPEFNISTANIVSIDSQLKKIFPHQSTIDLIHCLKKMQILQDESTVCSWSWLQSTGGRAGELLAETAAVGWAQPIVKPQGKSPFLHS